jgi:polysaccharide pyruvyl transferase WcaK-like protein
LANLRRIFGIGPAKVEIVYDPALWADKVYGIDLRGNARAIGLGIMAPLAYFSSISSPVGEFCTDRLKELWCATIGQLASEGHAVVLFSNGAPEDQRFAEEIFESIPDVLRGAVSLRERPRSPEELVKMISEFKAIVAQRLHAHIVAYAVGVPSVGLIWDSKVKEFGELTRRQEFFLELAEATAEKLIERVGSALAQGVNSEHRRRLRDNAYFGVVRLLSRAGLTTEILERSSAG